MFGVGFFKASGAPIGVSGGGCQIQCERPIRISFTSTIRLANDEGVSSEGVSLSCVAKKPSFLPNQKYFPARILLPYLGLVAKKY